MHCSPLLLAALAALAQIASSTPAHNNNCGLVTQAIGKIHASSSATKFCSSYLGIKTSTKTITKTTKPSIPPAKTATVTKTATVSTTTTKLSTSTFTATTTIPYKPPTVTRTDTVTLPPRTDTETGTTTVTDTVTETTTPTTTVGTTTTITSASAITCASAATTLGSPAGVKRGQTTTKAPSSPISTPSCFKGYPRTALSSACSCLSIKPSTRTKTTTVGGGYPIAIPTTTVTKTTTVTNTATITRPASVTPSVTVTYSNPGDGRTDTATVTVTKSATDVVTITTFGRTETVATTTITSTADTTTVTTTTTATAAGGSAPVPALTGLRYLYYVRTPPNTGGPGDPELYRANYAYAQNGVVNNANDIGTNPTTGTAYLCRPPLDPTTPCSNAAVVMQGFLYAPVTGRYILSFPPVDASGWAFSSVTGYGRDIEWGPPTADVYGVSNPSSAGVTAFDLVEGELLPMSLVWINTGGAGAMEVTIQGPDGTTQGTAGRFLPPCGESRFVPEVD